MSRLTVITGPPGTDIGRAVAAIAIRVGIRDGMAVRVVDTGFDASPHTSPDPYHGQADGTSGAVRLKHLPSAWQHPETNLAVVFTGRPMPLADDIHTLASLGLNPSHRLTVQVPGRVLARGWVYPLPIESGDVGVQARDVLRGGGQVVVEAGDGMTHMTALAVLRLAPWAPWLDRLDLWVAVDGADVIARQAPGEKPDLLTYVREAVDRAGGPAAGDATTVRVAITNPGLVDRDDVDRVADAYDAIVIYG